ncbi:PG0541 family transporter-associated protein [Borrelia hispanica]|uniref:PG0541 family transporter-associated protein n=1 Tax=Borrelia hispanica TaxID=40835 RepID=UPI00046383E5|nr:PG0541 family transporter-associated protein [Borrelia hispanica]
MYRVEIISNFSLEFDFHECITSIEEELGEIIYYSKVYNVKGKGRKGERQGNEVWPEENFIFIVYTDKLIIVEKLKNITEILGKKYPTEGIKFFVLGN